MKGSSANTDHLHGPARAIAGIRVVLLERDSDVRLRLQRLLDEEPLFIVSAATDSWLQCEALLDEYAPELLIIGPGQLPAGVTFPQSEFPVMLRLGGACHECRLALGGMECRHLQRVLMELANEIYLRKANQLSSLLDRYFEGVASFNYVSTLRVERDGTTLDVPVERICALEASGNYVRLHADSGTYELRETISGLSARLEPEIFVRVHRSYVVNVNHIAASRLEDSSPHVTLSSGQIVPIGPNFRADISRLLAERLKLTA